MERDRLRSILESLLFLADGPLTPHRLGELAAGADKKEILSALAELQSEYETQGRGIRVVEVAGGFQFRTPKENADWIKNLYRGKAQRMTRATLETLAIIAYKQPVTRAEIESIRGVDVDGVLSTLLERRLVRIVARKDVPGRPFLYGTTSEFLEMFNLKDLTGLPTLKEMESIVAPALPPKDEAAQEVPERVEES